MHSKDQKSDGFAETGPCPEHILPKLTAAPGLGFKPWLKEIYGFLLRKKELIGNIVRTFLVSTFSPN